MPAWSLAAEQLRTYECDGLTLFRVMPELVLLPSSAQEMQAIVKVCHRERIPFVARGAGTGLSGGALPVKGGVVIGVSRMNRILEVDVPNARVVVEPGVTNSAITAAVSPHGYFYAPDPSSQVVCTVGGNVAENSGGAHCFKYGVTTTYILGAGGRFSPTVHWSGWAARPWTAWLRSRRRVRRFGRDLRDRH